MIPLFYLASGLLERINGNLDKSLECFENAFQIYELRIECDSNDANAIINKATLLCYMDRKNEGVEFINSISLDDKNQMYINDYKEQLSEVDIEIVIQDMMKKKK